uniref:Solute-binding protein family 3/N-terminal domain-containing protein n=1 Tax=Magnetococcus massalia (strain MO-1) TaxID=451514 RepID=A0A1S7LIG7_MAGMO|nr:Conserved exported protein of unknown function [Candidatus Magnetococcus massalia]
MVAMGPPSMSRIGLSVLVLTLIIFGTCTVAAQEPQSVVWLHPDFEPVFIMQGPQKGQGVGDQVVQLVREQLPQYHHITEVANFKRIIATIGSNQRRACCLTLLKNPEREKKIAFSEPYMLSPQNAIITLKSKLSALARYTDSQGRVSLTALMRAPEWTLGFAQGRSYSSEIDTLLQREMHDDNSIHTSRTDIFEGLMRMLQYGRIDFTLAYGYEAYYMAQKLGFANQMVSLPIQEAPPYSAVYVGCPDTPWGHGILDAVNGVMRQFRLSSRLLSIYKPWLDASAWQRYQQDVRRFFQTRTANPDTS